MERHNSDAEAVTDALIGPMYLLPSSYSRLSKPTNLLNPPSNCFSQLAPDKMPIVVYWLSMASYCFCPPAQATNPILDAPMDSASKRTRNTVVSGARAVCFLKIPIVLTS